MTAKEYLLQAQKAARLVRFYEGKIEELRHTASGIRAITYDGDRVQTSPADRTPDMIAKLVEVENRYNAALLSYHDLIQKITWEVGALDSPDYVQVLTLRYLSPDDNGRLKSLEEIACIMNRSFHRIAHLHGEALEAFRRRYL